MSAWLVLKPLVSQQPAAGVCETDFKESLIHYFLNVFTLFICCISSTAFRNNAFVALEICLLSCDVLFDVTFQHIGKGRMFRRSHVSLTCTLVLSHVAVTFVRVHTLSHRLCLHLLSRLLMEFLACKCYKLVVFTAVVSWL